VRPTCE
jgi:2-keto-4-pentenoate hydratase/2-oxohepta-3-ene-1,7-dioic acid hydratase in catechol pathway